MKVAAILRRVYWFVFRPRTFGVKCLVVHDGHWLMIRNTYGVGHWTFPGGGMNRHETAADAAKRETREEVGIWLKDVRPIGDYYSTKQYKRDTVYCFTADVTSSDFVIQPSEIAEARWIAPDEIPQFHSRAVDRIIAMLQSSQQ